MREMGREKGQGRTGRRPVQSAPRPWHRGRSGFWVHRLLEANRIESRVVGAASIAVPRRRLLRQIAEVTRLQYSPLPAECFPKCKFRPPDIA